MAPFFMRSILTRALQQRIYMWLGVLKGENDENNTDLATGQPIHIRVSFSKNCHSQC